LEEVLFPLIPLLNNSKLNLELQITVDWKKDYIRLTKEMHDFYKPFILSLYLQSIYDLSDKISKESKIEFENLDNELNMISVISEHLQERNLFTTESRAELSIFRNILIETRKNYCKALTILKDEAYKISSMIKSFPVLKHPEKGLPEFKKLIKKSEIITSKTKIKILSYMKNNLSHMRTLKIETHAKMDKCDYWERELNINYNRNLLIRTFLMNTSGKIKKAGLKPSFIESFYYPLFHLQTPKRLLKSLTDEIQSINNAISIT
jgi:hypothetical protein